jgi:hypothetical protein
MEAIGSPLWREVSNYGSQQIRLEKSGFFYYRCGIADERVVENLEGSLFLLTKNLNESKMKSTSGIVTAAAVAFGMISCETTPEEEAAIWNKPPRYGHGGTQAEQGANAAANQQKANRFGFGGENPAGGQVDNPAGNPAAADSTVPAGPGNTLGATPGENTVAANDGAAGKMDQKKEDPPKTGGNDSKSSPPNSLKSYPFGKPVPGKSGFVTLPSPHDGLGEIDVRGIAPGTPVEIPDPGKPGKKIYFRVP